MDGERFERSLERRATVRVSNTTDVVCSALPMTRSAATRRAGRLAVTIGHRDGAREVHVVADDAPGRGETDDARFVAAARTDAKRRDRAAVAAVREARRRVERTAEALGVSTKNVLEAVVPDGAVACRTAAPMVVVDDLGLAGISSIVSPRAHENAVETMLALCPEMRACDWLSGMRLKSAQSETKTSVLIDGEGRFGIAVTTRIVREEDDATPRRSSTTWRRWGAPRGRWPKARTNRSSMGTLTRRILPSASLTVCQRFSIQVSPKAVERHALWPCLETGCVADGLLRVALARKDGREMVPSAAVDVRDPKLLSENAREFSYAELLEASVRVAHFIKNVLHTKPGDVVAVMSRNSYEVFVLHHACALVRCVLLNLNTHLVSRELTYILRDSECRFVFARRREHSDVLNEVVPLMETNAVDSIIWMVDDDDESSESGIAYPSHVKNFDWNSDALAFQGDEHGVLTVLNEELSQIKDAHLYYTSGTTGNPKGVCLKHEVVLTHARATSIEMRLNSQDTWLHAAPMFHLVDAFAIYSITEVCGRHVFLSAFETTRLLRVIASERVTVTNLASSMVAIMAHHPLCGVIDLSSLRLVSCGGSPLPPTAVRRAIALFGCEFFVSYGMTECCGKISMSILSDEFRKYHSVEEQVDAVCTSGRPFCLMSIKVLQPDDGRTVVVSDGRTVGEVFIKGPTLFSGYLKNPEATRRSFDEQGYFATGDLAVVQPNGFISIVDRKKDMILSGGENVYCVEVERVIHAHRAVKQASVLGIPNSIMGEVVHAVVTLKNPSDDETPSDITADLMRHCESQLSRFKCPSAIHIVDALPLNASGKVLKRRLREMVVSGEAITVNEARASSRVQPRDRRSGAAPHKSTPRKVDRGQISLNAKDDHKAREVFVVGTSHFDKTLRRDAVSVVPITRWDICDVNDRMRVKSGFLCGFGVFLDEATMFDSQMFSLSDMEAVVADPQQRLILKSVSTLPVRPKPCASVHIGVSQVEFPRIFVNVREELSPYYATSAHLSVVAGRVCFTFALSGHAESIDTACSSSLVATHRGYETHSQSIVGGVNLTIDVTWSLACHTANMLSADGRCKTLDASADGYVRAEHCAVLLLSCDQACPTRVVKLCGVAVNQDGRSSSLTAPNGPSQTKVITAAYVGAIMESVALHGTGTPLGDPIEVGALQAAMNEKDSSPVQMYAPKSLVGHSEPASGVTGIVLNIRSIVSSEFAPLVHLRCVNPHLKTIEKTRDIIMPRELTSMGDKRSASASAFAFQGTNAHGLIHRYSKFLGTVIVKRRHMHESMLWCARHVHGWIKTGCILYGRIILSTTILRGLPCASLRDHVIHGQSIAPGTALLEIFVESFVNSSNSDVHGSAIVIPHAFKLEGRKKDGLSTVGANVIVRRHDGRIAVTSGPLCQPRTHLYGQACKVHARERFSSVRSRLWMKREIPGRIFASIEDSTHRSSQPHSTNLNACTLDAAIHLAESVLQYHTALQARIPAGLASISAGKHKRGEDSVQRIVKTNCAFGDDDGYLKRALHDHFTNHVLLHRLEIRSPLRDCGKTPIRRASRSLVYTSCHHAELSPREKIITRVSVFRSAREDDSTRCLASMITSSTIDADDSVLALQKHSEVSSALVGALRSATHEKNTSFSVVRCFQYNESTPVGLKDGDPWTVPRFMDGGSKRIRILSPAHLRQGKKNDFNPRHKKPNESSMETVTVYGGTGALGMYSAKNLGSNENSRRVRVTGRSGRTSQRLHVVDSCQIASLRCDGGTKSETAGLASAAIFGRSLYTSGILADAIWKKLSFRLVTIVCAPKLNCKRDQLDYVRAIACRVFFSSTTACVGNSGQTVYGAANSVLDHRAASACSMGVNALSLQWGAFSGGGMASGVESHLSRIGIGVLTPDICVKVLRWCVTNRSKLVSSSLCVSNFDWKTFSTFHLKTRESKFFSAVIDGRGQTPAIKGKAQVKAVTENVDARKIIESAMQSILGQVPSGDCPFFDAGMDSLSSVEFVSAVDESLNMSLPATVVFDYPTPSALIRYLESFKTNQHAKNATKVPSKVEIDKSQKYDLAAKFRVELPGEADTKVWLARDRVTHVTYERWCYDENAHVPFFGGFYVTDWTLFDVSAFDLQMNESIGIDPQQRATLKHAAEVLYSYSNHYARPSCAVYIGAATTDYMSLAIRVRDSSPYLSTGCAFLSVIAGRISYMLNLSGTALVIDTACSSSLSALHVAHNSPEELRCVGGVNAMLAYQTTAMFATAGMLALDGRCKTLDASADGYARAEGCALTLLQRCKTDSEVERVLLDGTAVNQDGRSSSLTAPNGPSQTLVILASNGYSDSLSNTHNLHGTGTALGDPIEVNATVGALRADNQVDSIPIILDASKSLCAHSESPSGLIGLASALTTLSQVFSVGIMHMRELNAHVCASLCTNPLGILRTRAAAAVALKSGVSAFAFQGTNAHCVVSSKLAQRTHDFINGLTLFDSVRCWQLSPSSKALILSTIEFDRVCFYVRPTITTLDHRVNGQSLLPGAAYLELVSLCGRSLGNGSHISVIEAVFVSPFNLKKSASCVIHRGRATFKINGAHQLCLAKASMSDLLRQQRARLATFERCVCRHRGIYVDGNVDETAGEDDGKAMQIDSSFHFVSATWDSCKSLGIPVSVKYFALTAQYVNGGGARVNRNRSDHFSHCADVFGLETHTLSRSEIPTKSMCKAYIAKQIFSPKSRQKSGFKWQGMNAKPLLSALSMWPSSCVALECSESTMNFGIFAALRSVALETSLPCRIFSRNCGESILAAHPNRQMETSRRPLRVLGMGDARYGKEIYISGGSGGLGRCITKNFVPHRFSAARWTCRRGRGRVIFSGIDGTLTLNTPDSLYPTPPCAVIHASGSLADTLWSNLMVRSVISTFASKCAGTSFAYIDREMHPIGFSNTFSSIASLLGSLGQAAYAGSNEMLDARCRVEFHRGRNASSTQWGPWAGSGMGDKDVVRSRLKQIGIEYLSTRDAIGMLITQLSSSVAVLCAASIDWTTHVQATGRKNDPMFRELVDLTGHRAAEKAPKIGPSSRKRCSKEILSRVLTCVEQSLGCKIHESDPFMDSGIDSMISIELTNILAEDFSLKLPSTFLFDYPTAAAVADYIHGSTEVPKTELVRLDDETPEQTVYVDAHLTSHPSSQRWDSVARIPTLKWRVDELRLDRLAASFMTVLLDSDMFDASLFSMTKEEACRCDCQQRLLLHASLVTRVAGNTRCGVYIGIASHDHSYCLGSEDQSVFDAVGSFSSVASGRISYVFNYRGPACSIDTACSSSLFAMHHMRMEMSREMEKALAGGINIITHPRVTEQFNRAGMLSLSGRCQTLDQAADGYVRAEACVLAHFGLACNNTTVCALRASAANQDGRSSALTAPNGPAQRQVIDSCGYTIKFGHCFHLHGTGTPLGDPIEVNAINTVLQQANSVTSHVESSKSWIGHAEPASGIASVCYSLKQFAQCQEFGYCRLSRLNAHLETIFGFLHANRTHAPGKCTSVGISSFAFQGSNVHVVIDDSHLTNLVSSTPRAIDARRCACGARLFESIRGVHVTGDVRVVFSGNTMRSPCISDHRVSGRALFPGAAMMHISTSAASIFSADRVTCSEFLISSALEIASHGTEYHLHLQLTRGSCSFIEADCRRRYFTALVQPTIVTVTENSRNPARTREHMRASHRVPVNTEVAYSRMCKRGLEYGIRFRILQGIRASDHSSRIAFMKHAQDELDQIAATDGIMQLAAPFGAEPLAVPIGADLFFTSFKRFESAYAWTEIADCAPTTHRLSNPSTLVTFILKLRVKSLALRSVASPFANLYTSERCSLPEAPLGKYYGKQIFSFSRAAIDAIQCAQMMPDRCRVAGVQTDHLSGLARTFASETQKEMEEFTWRHHETSVFVERMAIARASQDAPRTRGELLQSKRRSKTITRVIGGFGALGMVVVMSELHRPEVTMVILDGRTGRGRVTRALIKTGGVLKTMKRDVSCRSDMNGTDACREILSSGTLLDGLLKRHTPHTVRFVHAPKSNAASGARAQSVILFSSISALLGSSGQANYASANSSLDFIARTCRRIGVDNCSIQFGPWSESGMATRHAQTLQRLESMGIFGLGPDQSMYLLHVAFTKAVICLAAFNVRRLATTQSHLSELFSDWLKENRKKQGAIADVPTGNYGTVSRDSIHDELSSMVAKLLGSAVDPLSPLMQSGLDSLSAMELTSSVSKAFKIDLPSTFFFDHPNISVACDEIMCMRGSGGDSKVVPTAVQIVDHREEKNKHLVASAGCAFSTVSNDAVQPIPIEREPQKYSSAANMFAACVPHRSIVSFDSATIGNASSTEFLTLDPRQRILISITVCCLSYLRTPLTGVFMGASGKDYSRFLQNCGVAYNPFTSTGNETSVIAGRLSYIFDLKGPALIIDTACSSSLCAATVALETDTAGALIGGASLILTNDMHLSLGGAGMLSQSGRCRTFDQQADGYGRGEAVEVMYASSEVMSASAILLTGGAMNQDGRSSSLTAPNGKCQQNVINRAIIRSSRQDILREVILHAHGTGTALGDPIEMNAALAVYTGSVTAQALKSWWGHTEPASGALALISAKIQLGQTRQLLGICHLRRLSNHLSSITAAIKPIVPRESQIVSTSCADVGISAFAFQGTNAHIILSALEMFHCFTGKHVTSDHRLHWPLEVPGIASVRFDDAAINLTVDGSVGHCFCRVVSCLEALLGREKCFALKQFIGNQRKSSKSIKIKIKKNVIAACCVQGRLTKAPDGRLNKSRPALLRGKTHITRLLRGASVGSIFFEDITCDIFLLMHCSSAVMCGQSPRGARCVADDGAVVFMAVGMRKLHSRMFKPQVCYTVEETSVRDVVRNDVRSVAGALILAHQRARARVQDRGLAIDVIFRNAQHEMGVKSKRPSITPVHLGSSARVERSLCIFGGTGALGTSIAVRIQSPSSHIYGRTGKCVRTPNLLTRTCFEVKRVDASTRSETSDETLRTRPDDAILHAGGVLADASFEKQCQESLRVVFAPKLNAVVNCVRESTRSNAHVIFSSIAALLAPPGQLNYSCANACLDEYAGAITTRGAEVVSVRWGAFEGVGMASRSALTSKLIARLGVKMLPLDVGISVLVKILHGGHARLLSTPLVVSEFETRIQSFETRDDDVARTKSHSRSFVVDVIRSAVSELLGSSVARDAPLMESGLDSVTSVELKNIMAHSFDLELPTTVIFDHPTVDELACYCQKRLCGDAIRAGDSTRMVENHNRPPASARELHCLARSGRFFTGDLERALLENTTYSTAAVPLDRWDVESADGVGVRFVAFVKDVSAFDNALFGVSKPEAIAMDPQHRGILEEAFTVVSDQAEREIHTAVAIGIQHLEYGALFANSIQPSPFTATGSALSVCAGRVSYAFGFIKPSICVDTACSSSLTTIHLMLEEDSSSEYMCGGVNYILGKRNCDAVRVAGMLAPDGRCKVFDATADGYGRSEAVSMFRFGRSNPDVPVAFVVCASACGQDGRSASLTAPSGTQQHAVIQAAHRSTRHRFPVRTISLHGTGTALGDPIECSALMDAVDGSTLREMTFLASKSSGGHAEAAAGSLAVSHAAAHLALYESPVFLGLSTLNQHVRASNACVPRQLTATPIERPRGAVGCSAFAFMGTNAHVVLRRGERERRARRRPSRDANALTFEKTPFWPTSTISLALKTAVRAPPNRAVVIFQVKHSDDEPMRCRTAATLASACARACASSKRIQCARVVVADGSGFTTSYRGGFTVRVRLDCGRASIRRARATCSILREAEARPRRQRRRDMNRHGSTVAYEPPRVAMARHRQSGASIDDSELLHVVGETPRRSLALYRDGDPDDDRARVPRTFATTTIRADSASLCAIVSGDVSGDFTIYGENATTTTTTTTRGWMSRRRRTITKKSNADPSSSVVVATDDVSGVVMDTLRELFGGAFRDDENLSARGLDSIAAVELATTLRTALGLDEDIDVATLATCATPGKMVDFCVAEIKRRRCGDSSSIADAEGETKREDDGRTVSMIKCLRSRDVTETDAENVVHPPSLFLGAPAFGDGPLAYVKLVDALTLGAHAAHTLERDTTSQPWPEAAEAHAREIMRRQPSGGVSVGGHSLGGVLAIETALSIERAGRRVDACLLFDAPHPVQFKSEWNDVSPVEERDGPGTVESTGLAYMEVALQSFHFDTASAGWSTLSRDEKYDVFESVVRQATGRDVDARKLDEQISAGPYAAQWNAAMPRMDDGSVDSSAWWMLRGTEAKAANDDTRPARFTRLKARVSHYKAGVETDALFETDLRLDADGRALRSVGGYVWPLACDDVEIVHCRGSHMNLMTDEEDGGDLRCTVVPHARRALEKSWKDLADASVESLSSSKAKNGSPRWRWRVWDRALGLWMRASPSLAKDMDRDDEEHGEEEEEEGQSLLSSSAALRFVNALETFDRAAFGLNNLLAWDRGDTPVVWVVGDLIADVEAWSKASFASALPIRAVHVPRCVSRRAAGEVADVAARCVGVILRQDKDDGDDDSDDDGVTRVPMIIAALHHGGVMSEIAFETAMQLKRRGASSVSVVVADEGADAEDEPALRRRRHRRSIDDRSCFQAYAMKLAETEAPRGWRELPIAFRNLHHRTNQNQSHSRRSRRSSFARLAREILADNRPPSIRPSTWTVEIDAEVRACDALIQLARGAFHPGVISAHVDAFDAVASALQQRGEL